MSASFASQSRVTDSTSVSRTVRSSFSRSRSFHTARVIIGGNQRAHIRSALAQLTDVRGAHRDFPFVQQADICSAAKAPNDVSGPPLRYGLDWQAPLPWEFPQFL